MVVDLICNGKILRALADPGSELNIISDQVVDKIGLHRRKLHQLTRVGLAMKTSDTPEAITHFTCTDLINPTSKQRFDHSLLKIGKIEGEHEIILGTPSLDSFQFSVSISQRAMICERTGMKLVDSRHLRETSE